MASVQLKSCKKTNKGESDVSSFSLKKLEIFLMLLSVVRFQNVCLSDENKKKILEKKRKIPRSRVASKRWWLAPAKVDSRVKKIPKAESRQSSSFER